MISSMTWGTSCLVVLSHRTWSAAWHHAVGSPGTIAVPCKWSTRPALHCSRTIRTSCMLHTFFSKVGMCHHVSCPHAHQQNTLAERKHRHIVEASLALLAHDLLKCWDDAFLAAIYLINRTPSRTLNYETHLE
jgi:hypothetical protein